MGVLFFCVAAITNYYKFGALKQQELFFHGTGGQKSEIS